MNLPESPMQKIVVGKIMNNSVVSVDSSVSATDAAKMMEDTDVGAVIILENGSPIGIVTDRDFAIKITAHSYPIDTPVRRIMSAPLISVDSSSDIWEASDLMSARNVRKLPVIDDDKVVGIITSSDIVKYIADH
ncbi:MAG: Homoserine O-acetyltransferase [Nitrosopumilus sp.]|nr:Homoserine O-acetyltransferase [Nitrosopumilus sp.]